MALSGRSSGIHRVLLIITGKGERRESSGAQLEITCNIARSKLRTGSSEASQHTAHPSVTVFSHSTAAPLGVRCCSTSLLFALLRMAPSA